MSKGKKFGEGSLSAAARLGLAELRQAASFGGNIEQPTPYGMYGTPTPGEIAKHSSQSAEVGKLPSPSEVIDNPKAYLPKQEHGQSNQQENAKQQEHGREM